MDGLRFPFLSSLPRICLPTGTGRLNDMLAIHHLFVCYYQNWNLDTLPETIIAPEN